MREVLCRTCESRFLVDYTRLRVPDKGELRCKVCNRIVFSWNDNKLWRIEKILEEHHEHETPSGL